MTASVERIGDDPAILGDCTVLVDLDSTLFDTRRFGADLCREIAYQAAKPVEEVIQDATAFRLNTWLGGYSFEQHVSAYRLNPPYMWRCLGTLLNGTRYVYDDAPEFIQGLRADGFEPRILSYGEQRIQTQKITSCLRDLVGPNATVIDYEVTNRPKRVTIGEQYPGGRGVLVDDIQGQQLPSGFMEINLDRSRKLRDPEQIVGGFVVSNLAQARELIVASHS